MFELTYGLRLWQRQKWQLLLLITGFGFLTALIHVVLSQAPALFSQKPAWVAAEGQFATIGFKGHDGSMQPISLKRLEAYQKGTGVESMAYIGEYSPSRFRIKENLHNGSVLLVSDELAALLELPTVAKNIDRLHQSAYLSHRFWLKNFPDGQDPVGQPIYLGHEGYPLTIAGVLPPALDRIGKWQPDILIGTAAISPLINVTFPDQQAMPAEMVTAIKKQIAHEMPAYYGIAKLLPTFDAATIRPANELPHEGAEKVTKVLTSADNMDEYFYPGIEFNPDGRNLLLKQWWLLLYLTLGFGIVNGLNLFTVSFARLVARQQEFSVRIAVGGHGLAMLRQLLLEQLPLLFVSLALGATLSIFLRHALHTHGEQMAANYSESIVIYFLTALAVLIVVAICAILPLVQLLNSKHFSRSQGEQNSRVQHWLGQLNLATQIALAAIALSVVFSLGLSQWQRMTQLPLQQGVLSWQLTNDSDDKLAPVDSKGLQHLLGEMGLPVALSQHEFIHPATLSVEARLESQDNPQHLSLNAMAVSINYFDMLGATFLAGGSFDENSLVLNRAAATALSLEAPESLVGKNVYLANNTNLGFAEDQTVRISGIVSDLPHYGMLQQATPMIYTDINRQNIYNKFHVIALVDKKTQIKEALVQYDQREGGLWQISGGIALTEQLRLDNGPMERLTFGALTLAGLVAALAAASLYYQFSSHLQLQQRRYGVMLAVGGQPRQVIFALWRSLVTLMLFALAPVVVALIALAPWLQRELHTFVLSASSLLLAASLILVICLGSSMVPGIRLTFRPVADLLRNKD
ncbi:MAG TPA: hypothetical protein DF774_01400 [Rheinheimera sp.]|uniref:ABC transporter permease n=1 Tax=Rheinheimera sp. TaxID=1869214 RepID=UPI000EE35DA2|nr:ABC transporter permease [Rheinheimera sp.]HCU64395.1 hypothetical protein [Rheinheimera sp.]